MAQFVLEIVNLPIPATTDLESGPAAERWQEALTIGAGTPGCLAIFWGRQIENPNVVDVVISEFILKDLSLSFAPCF